MWAHVGPCEPLPHPELFLFWKIGVGGWVFIVRDDRGIQGAWEASLSTLPTFFGVTVY